MATSCSQRAAGVRYRDGVLLVRSRRARGRLRTPGDRTAARAGPRRGGGPPVVAVPARRPGRGRDRRRVGRAGLRRARPTHPRTSDLAGLARRSGRGRRDGRPAHTCSASRGAARSCSSSGGSGPTWSPRWCSRTPTPAGAAHSPAHEVEARVAAVTAALDAERPRPVGRRPVRRDAACRRRSRCWPRWRPTCGRRRCAARWRSWPTPTCPTCCPRSTCRRCCCGASTTSAHRCRSPTPSRRPSRAPGSRSSRAPATPPTSSGRAAFTAAVRDWVAAR